MAVICAVTFTGCEKDEQESFKFDIENLYGTWQGIAIQSNGEWIDTIYPILWTYCIAWKFSNANIMIL